MGDFEEKYERLETYSPTSLSDIHKRRFSFDCSFVNKRKTNTNEKNKRKTNQKKYFFSLFKFFKINILKKNLV